MSIEYCFKHDISYDTDYNCECSGCEEEETEKQEAKENKEEYSRQINEQLRGLFKSFNN